jgi:hypothetical protein
MSTLQKMRSLLRSLSFCLAVALPTLLLCFVLLRVHYELSLIDGAMRFARPWAGLLSLGALLALLSRGLWDHARAPRLRFSRNADLAALPVGVRVRLRPLLYALRVVALLLCVTALMRPQSIHARERNELHVDEVLS